MGKSKIKKITLYTAYVAVVASLIGTGLYCLKRSDNKSKNQKHVEEMVIDNTIVRPFPLVIEENKTDYLRCMYDSIKNGRGIPKDDTEWRKKQGWVNLYNSFDEKRMTEGERAYVDKFMKAEPEKRKMVIKRYVYYKEIPLNPENPSLRDIIFVYNMERGIGRCDEIIPTDITPDK